MGEARTVSVSTRIPQGWLAYVERHRHRMRQTTRQPRVTLADALRDLLALGIESQEPGVQLFGGEQIELPHCVCMLPPVRPHLVCDPLPSCACV